MRSPFPGMDPYLEAHWRHVHPRLCIYACAALQPQLQPALLQPASRQEWRPALQVKIATRRVIGGDVCASNEAVVQSEPLQTSEDGSVAQPLIIPDVFEHFLEIIEPDNDRRVVTTVEFFTASHKSRGRDQERYIRKRWDRHDACVNLVEIDLLRSGDHILTRYNLVPVSYRTTYQVCVRRDYKGQTEVYPVPLQRGLPTIRVPLREGDTDAHLDLQAVFEKAYRDGVHGNIDYTQPPNPPLDAADAVWAGELLQAAALDH